MHQLYKIKFNVKKQNHDVSVICCVKNGALYAKNCLDSILNQKSCNFKLMILDDGSDDDTAQICVDILKQNLIDYEIYRSNTNMGVPIARNTLINICTSKYIAIHDIDDIMMPFRLCIQNNFLNQFFDIDCVGGHACKINVDGDFVDTMSYPPRDNADIVDMLPGRVNPMIDPTTMMRLSSFKKMNGYSENENVRLAQDFDLWIRMCKSGMKLANIQSFFTQYRVLDSGLTLSRKNEMIKAHVYVQSMHRPFLENIRRNNGKSK